MNNYPLIDQKKNYLKITVNPNKLGTKEEIDDLIDEIGTKIKKGFDQYYESDAYEKISFTISLKDLKNINDLDRIRALVDNVGTQFKSHFAIAR